MSTPPRGYNLPPVADVKKPPITPRPPPKTEAEFVARLPVFLCPKDGQVIDREYIDGLIRYMADLVGYPLEEQPAEEKE